MTTRHQIDEFLALKRLAVVGVSRDPKHFSQALWKELRQRRSDVVPVNPAMNEFDGRPCMARVQDIQPPVDGVVILTRSQVTATVVHDCADAGVTHVWMHRGAGGGPGAVSQSAVEFCEAHGIDVVAGYCPFMFLPGTPVFHGLHAGWKKLTRSYPH